MVTYGWVAATYESVDILKKAARRHPLQTLVLIALAGEDRVVSNNAVRKFTAGAGNVRMFEIEGARHEFLQEADDRRNVFWQAFDEFLGM